MARLRVTILGCGSSPGVPRIGNDWGKCDPDNPRNRRRRSSILVQRLGEHDGLTNVLVDTSPDMRDQMLDAGIRTLDGVLYTHAHADHIHGIDDLRAFWINSGERVDIYADQVTTERLHEAFAYCFDAPESSFYPPILRANLIHPWKPVEIEGAGGALLCLPFTQKHGSIHTLGFRFGGLAYSPDVSDLDAEAVDALQDLDVWIVDALRDRPHPSHFSLEDALAWIERVKPKRAILTHMHVDLDYETLRAELPPHVEPAYDGMVIELDGQAHE